ncbi:hypothetical protein Taro_036428 [Colocasia esculenta]|uniref:Uncharacterized protein n=1 Tax=Colocasia esculenta TaxID=4460 RepID=A0A843W6R9_COLES|nr:hypothetical protein [Colocasia esculenta]
MKSWRWKSTTAMVSRDRSGAQAREDKHRREERGEKQAPASQGPTLKAQAHAPAPVPQEHGHGGPSIMERFKKMAPPSFKGESQPLLAESWMREVEKIFWAIRYAEENKEIADVWWAFVLRIRYEDGAIEALSAACKQESRMDQYLEEKRAAQKRLMASCVSLTSWAGNIDVQIDGRRLPVNDINVVVYFSVYVCDSRSEMATFSPGETGVHVLEEDVVRSDSEREEELFVDIATYFTFHFR